METAVDQSIRPEYNLYGLPVDKNGKPLNRPDGQKCGYLTTEKIHIDRIGDDLSIVKIGDTDIPWVTDFSLQMSAKGRTKLILTLEFLTPEYEELELEECWRLGSKPTNAG